MISQKAIFTGLKPNNLFVKIYTLNTLLHFVETGFWLVAIIGVLMKSGSLQDSALYFSYFLIFESFFNILFSFFDRLISIKIQTIVGMISFTIGSVLFIAISTNSQLFLPFLFFGLGIAAMNGSAPAWFVIIKKSSFKKCADDIFHGNLNYCRRLGQMLNIPTGTLLIVSPNLPWYIMLCASIIFIVIAIKIPINPVKNRITKKLNANFNWFLIPLVVSQVFYGMEFAIRNVLINPFVLYELNSGNFFMFSLKIASQVIAGFAGNYFYNNWICTQMNQRKELYLAAALLIYGIFDFVTSVTSSYTIWMTFQTLAIFSMGWYFPILDSFITENIPDKWLGLGHSLNSAIYSGTGGIFLYFVHAEMTYSSIRNWFQLAALTLTCSATIIYLYALASHNFVKLMSQKKENI